MNAGIIGAGQIGTALAERLVATGHRVSIANSRGPDSLRELAARLGPSLVPGTTAEVAKREIVASMGNVALPALVERAATEPDVVDQIAATDTLSAVQNLVH